MIWLTFNIIHIKIKNWFNSTNIDHNYLSIIQREEELHKIWNTFKSAQFVITDRLHARIFCYITNTPCLVFQNNNHKVRETYDWNKSNRNINLVAEFSQERFKDFLMKTNFNIGQMLDIYIKYKPLIKALKNSFKLIRIGSISRY